MLKSAIISDCGAYRYSLSRIWDESLPAVAFIMCNPSTADSENDDPTIRRCIAYAKQWGYGALLVGNMYAFRATNPKELLADKDISGPKNMYYLIEVVSMCDMVVCAWGNNAPYITTVSLTTSFLKTIKPLYHLGLTKQGQPKHPLYLKKDLVPIPWEV